MDIMLDIETADTAPTARILSIGAVKFFRDDSREIPSKDTVESEHIFYRRIDRESCISRGLTESKDTLVWWSCQSDAARNEALNHHDCSDLHTALSEFIEWFKPTSGIIWAKGPSFDCTIMEHAFKASGLVSPWKFWNQRDCRTATDISGIGRNNNKPSHNALDDCHQQVDELRAALCLLLNK
jgi:DNA polymerase III epsilon subunit-like protein